MLSLVNWAKALECEFFSLNDWEEEVFLYVNDDVLNRIGEKHKLGDVNNFLNSVLVPRDYRQDLYFKLINHGYIINAPSPKENRIIKGHSILEFGKLLSESIKPKTSIALLYTVLVMYIGNQALERNVPIGIYLSRYLKNVLDDNGKYQAISFLFEMVNKRFPSFNNKLRTDETYIGLIKYQLILSPREIEEIEEALYKTQYDDTYYSNISDKINKIYDYLSDNLRLKLNNAYQDKSYQDRINIIFRNFDREEYEISHEAIRIKQHAEFALVLAFSGSTNQRGFHLVSNYRPKEPIITKDFVLHSSIDSIGAYNNRYVSFRDTEYVNIKEYSFVSDELEIRSIPLGSVVQFYKQDNGIYLQSRDYLPNSLYVFVKNNHIEQWENWASTHAKNWIRLDRRYNVTDLTQGLWALYYADSITDSYYNNHEPIYAISHHKKEIIRKESIKQSGKKNTYLVNALPYFEFPSEIQESSLRITLWAEASRSEQTRRKLGKQEYTVIVDGRKLIIDLNSEIEYNRSTRIDVEISYIDNDLGDLQSNETFYVSGQHIAYKQEQLFSYDIWGDITERLSEAHIQGNIISAHRGKERLSNYRNTLDCVSFVSDESFYFINLLASTMYMESETRITRERLIKCIKYAATRSKINISQDRFITRAINLLVNCGYIAVDYRSSKYQAIPPCFSKIPRAFEVTDSSQIWMLSGTYTRMFLNNLRSFCKEKNVQIKYKYSDRINSSRSSLKLLPPIVLMGSTFSPEEFMKRYPAHKFDFYRDVDHAYNILSLTANISDYEKTLIKIRRENMDIRFGETKIQVYPRIREDNPGGYNNHRFIETSNRGDFLKPTLGSDWCNLYCHYKRNLPFIIKGDRHIYIPEDLHLPSIIQRSLFFMNVGIASYKKAFICNFESDKIYSTVKSYVINREGIEILKLKLAENNTQLFKEKSQSAGRGNSWRYKMSIWHRRDELDLATPKTLYTLSYEQNTPKAESDIIALAYYHTDGLHPYVPKRQIFTRVNNVTCNQLFSSLITDRRFNNSNLEFDDITFCLPSADKYEIEDIIIL